MKVINHHPTAQLLQQFADGALSPALSLGVSAHIDMCPQCQRAMDIAEAERAQQWHMFDAPEFSVASQAEGSELSGMAEFADMFASIVEAPQAQAAPVTAPPAAAMTLGQREFILPRALQRLAANTGRWQHLGKLWRAPLPLADDFKASFIFIEGDGQIPEHTHKGTEWTLVLDGAFTDEAGRYQAGDFIRCDGSNKHAPRTAAGEECLCFAVVEAPLHFTAGFSRLLNPLTRFMQ